MNVLISGGGTGGHVFPAIAIADAIRRMEPTCKLLFVGASGKIEMEKVPAAGYDIIALPIRGLNRSWNPALLLFPFRLVYSILKSLWILFKFKPDVVVGVGGYASGPVLRAASWFHIPLVIQEQNSFPGITNRLLAKSAAKICVAFEGMDRFFPAEKIMYTGNPIRSVIGQQKDISSACRALGLDPSKKTICVLGGSLGARSINEALLANLDNIRAHTEWQWLWQCGVRYAEELKISIPEIPEHVHIRPFIDKMDLAYAAADLIVARAGALTIAELCLTGSAAILVPSPNVAEDHQRKNAEALVAKSAACMIADDAVKESLWKMVEQLLQDDAKRNQLRQAAQSLATPEAANQIARVILDVTTKRR